MDFEAAVIPLHLHPLGLIEAFTQLGAATERVLRGTGIRASMLDDARACISYSQQARLIRNGVAHCRQPGLGLLVGQIFHWSYSGTVGGVLYCSPSLRAAGEAFQRYQMIAQPWYAYRGRKPSSYLDHNGLIVYPLHHFLPGNVDGVLRQFELEFKLATTLRIWDSCGNKSAPDPSVHVCLDYPEPSYLELYRRLPCASVQFGCARSYIAAHRKFVLEPFRPLRRLAFDRLIERCEEELRQAKLETSYTAKVRWHIFSRFNKRPTLEEIAAILDIAPRTLARRLAAERTTFRNIVHDVRMELTAHHLRLSTLSVDEIAELMGFSCTSSLRRAIRNWSGNAAGTVRSERAQELSPDTGVSTSSGGAI